MPNKSQEIALDKALIERFRNGDETAFEEMVLRYRDRIYARVLQLLKNRQDAEEVTQDAFVRAHRGLDKFRGDASFSTWLFQIATNLAHNKYWYWWRRKRDASLSLSYNLTDDGDATLEDVLPADGESPGEAAQTQELVDRVQHCMQFLSPKHREILHLRNVKNLSYEAIAQQLDISVGTVKSRIARARDSLRAKLGEEFK